MNSNIPYFITNDLEVTSGLPSSKYWELDEVRSEMMYVLDKALDSDVEIRQLSYLQAKQYFDDQKSANEFRVTTDGGIYISSPDFSIDSTRMYPNEEGILRSPKSYQIMTRDGKNFDDQNLILPQGVSSVGIYDDGMFSGDTMANLIRKITFLRDISLRIKVLLNFSWQNEVVGVPIDSYYQGGCFDWIDERDFYYGMKNSGASINPGGKVSGVPYISSPEMVSKKASIPESKSKNFCIDMIRINKKVWELIDGDRLLASVPRLAYLQQRYPAKSLLQDVLSQEEMRILQSY